MSASRWTPNAINLRYPDQAMLALGTGEYVLAADHERDVAAAEVRGWNAAVRQLAGEGCTWADGDCPNGTDCLSCKNLDALITERAKGDVQGWNAALSVVAADLDPEREMRHHSVACRCFGCDFQRRVAALRKPTEAQT